MEVIQEIDGCPAKFTLLTPSGCTKKIQSYDRKEKMAAPIMFFVKVYELVSRATT